ncbi:MAG: hypothetical protein IPH87_27460 [Anaerolineae bacterium]|nr:hypothetical protein [Anaerolineae bacterium]
MLAWLRQHGRLILITEVLFAVALAILAYTGPSILPSRDRKADGTHCSSTACCAVSAFPPLDAWLSVYSISYYYFGYVVLAVLTRLSGLTPRAQLQPGSGPPGLPGCGGAPSAWGATWWPCAWHQHPLALRNSVLAGLLALSSSSSWAISRASWSLPTTTASCPAG